MLVHIIMDALESTEAAILDRAIRPSIGGWPRAAAEAILSVSFDAPRPASCPNPKPGKSRILNPLPLTPMTSIRCRPSLPIRLPSSGPRSWLVGARSRPASKNVNSFDRPQVTRFNGRRDAPHDRDCSHDRQSSRRRDRRPEKNNRQWLPG